MIGISKSCLHVPCTLSLSCVVTLPATGLIGSETVQTGHRIEIEGSTRVFLQFRTANSMTLVHAHRSLGREIRANLAALFVVLDIDEQAFARVVEPVRHLCGLEPTCLR